MGEMILNIVKRERSIILQYSDGEDHGEITPSRSAFRISREGGDRVVVIHLDGELAFTLLMSNITVQDGMYGTKVQLTPDNYNELTYGLTDYGGGGGGGGGDGDMKKSVYDTNDSGVVDNAERLGGFEAEHFLTKDAAADTFAGKSDLETAVSDLEASIGDEATARQTAVSDLETGIGNEATARQTADEALQTGIGNETAARVTADAALTASVENEASIRNTADETEAFARWQGDASTLAEAKEYTDGKIKDVEDFSGTFVGMSFATKAELDDYTIPDRVGPGDFTFVLADEEHEGATTRYICEVDPNTQEKVFDYAYTLNQNFSDVQMAAINSGITATKLMQISGLVSANAAAIASESGTRQTADTTLQSNIDAEATARASGDASTLDTAKGYADTQDADVLQDAKDYTDTQVSTEATARSTGDASTLSAANSYAAGILATEEAERISADDNEAYIRQFADESEVSARELGDASTLADAKDYADGLIETEATAREAADDVLSDAINGKLGAVAHDDTLDGDGTEDNPLTVVGGGDGDMKKSVYDTNDSGVVDNAERLGGVLHTGYVREVQRVTGATGNILDTSITSGNYNVIVIGSDGRTYFGCDKGIKVLDDASGNIVDTSITTGNYSVIGIGSDGRTYFGSSNAGIKVLDDATGNIVDTNVTSGGYLSIGIGSDGRTYFGSDGAGIKVLDDATGNILDTSITSGYYLSIGIGSDGRTYFGSTSGIMVLDDASGNIGNTNVTSGTYNAIVIGSDGRTYFGSSSNGIKVLDDASGNIGNTNITSGYYIFIGIGSDGRTYFGSSNAGIKVLDDATGNIGNTNVTTGTYYAIVIGSDGRTYFGSYGAGIKVLDDATGNIGNTNITSGYYYAIGIGSDGRTYFVGSGTGIKVLPVMFFVRRYGGWVKGDYAKNIRMPDWTEFTISPASGTYTGRYSGPYFTGRYWPGGKRIMRVDAVIDAYAPSTTATVIHEGVTPQIPGIAQLNIVNIGGSIRVSDTSMQPYHMPLNAGGIGSNLPGNFRVMVSYNSFQLYSVNCGLTGGSYQVIMWAEWFEN